MNNVGQIILLNGICRSYGAGPVGGGLATKMPPLTELGRGIDDSICQLSKIENSIPK
jgi:hypothetical protein